MNNGKSGRKTDGKGVNLFGSFGIWFNSIQKIQAQQGIGAAGYFSLIKMLFVLNIIPGIWLQL